jgi:hypothetical protein
MGRLSVVCRPGWSELSASEKDLVLSHWTRHGHQENPSVLAGMAAMAGFWTMEVLWNDPDRFYAVLAFVK